MILSFQKSHVTQERDAPSCDFNYIPFLFFLFREGKNNRCNETEHREQRHHCQIIRKEPDPVLAEIKEDEHGAHKHVLRDLAFYKYIRPVKRDGCNTGQSRGLDRKRRRSEEHTSEL